MKMRLLLNSTLSLAASVLLAGSAHAITIAGWDFSQYLGAGVLSIDGATGANSLTANYSNLDPTFSAGAQSAAYGSMYIDGSFGSTSVDPFGSFQEFLPTAGSLASNLNAPVGGAPGALPFDSFTTLVDEGQTFANALAMTALAPANVVFRASTLAGNGTDWGLTFGAKTFSGTSSIGVSYSLDGLSYSAPTVVNIDSNDTPFSVAFAGVSAQSIYVRLALTNANGQPIIDNVSLNATVPEPASLILLGSALASLALIRRRHSA